MTRHTYSEEQLRNAVTNARSIRQTLQLLNIVPAGGNYVTLKKTLKKYNIDTKHFTGQRWNKNKRLNYKTSLLDVLEGNHNLTSHKLRIRLLSEGVFKHQCSQCLNTHWNGQPIPLELEHKDGCNTNNKLANLCVLCPNCHAQTSTYRRRKT